MTSAETPTIQAPPDSGAAAFEASLRRHGEDVARLMNVARVFGVKLRCECGGNRECPACLGEP